MVAKSFGEMAVGNVLSNWFPILMMLSPTVLAWVFRKALIPAPDPSSTGRRLRWAAMAGGLQLAAMGLGIDTLTPEQEAYLNGWKV